MYTAYFGLREKPFTIAPDPRYLYMSVQHQEALAHLLYGLQSDGGFVLLTGEVGTGKTTVCRRLLGQIPEQADIAVIFNPKLTVMELLETICDELNIPRPANASIKTLVDQLNARLLETNAAGRKTVLIIDEAQSLAAEVLEQLRLLTNLETDDRKLLQIVLLGQPELRIILGRPEMRQLAQRITARYHLGPLNCEEVKAYVRHRLEVAGCDRPIFPPATLRKIWRDSRGIPRLVNLICDRALLGAFTRNLDAVNRSVARQAAQEVVFETAAPAFWSSHRFAGLVALLFLAGLIISLAHTRLGWPPLFPLAGNESAPQLRFPPSEPAPVTTPPAMAPASAALPSDWPVDFAVGRSAAAALADLAALWGVVIPPETRDACGFAESAGLRCLSRQDSLVSLRSFNRPAVLTLYDDSGKPFHVLLAGLDSQRARFVAGQETRELDVAVLESRWFGEYQLLWKPPAFYSAATSPGDSGPAVPWLAQSLEDLGLYARNGSEKRLDGHLLGALKRYQLAAGLIPDGMLGPQTLIHLLNALGYEEPLLKPVEASN
jgi:general secretion pathway protein A